MKNRLIFHPSDEPPNYEFQLSIIIISFNTRDITRACLQSIRSATLKLKHEILVVDNASSDGSPEMITQEFPEVTLIRNSENLMFARANNQAMRIAKGRHLFLLNSDTLVEPGNVERLYEFMDQNSPKIGCVGPRVLNRDGSLQTEGEAFDSIRYVVCRFFFLHKLPLPFLIKRRILPPGFPDGMKGRTRKVGWVSGCAFMFSHALIKQLGALDEDFVFYCEDTEFCYRLQQHGFETWVVPEAKITHLGGASWLAAKTIGKVGLPDMPDYFARRFLFYRKTSGVSRKITINRLQVFLYSCLLPFLKLLRSEQAAQVQEKIKFHSEENRHFLDQLDRLHANR